MTLHILCSPRFYTTQTALRMSSPHFRCAVRAHTSLQKNKTQTRLHAAHTRARAHTHTHAHAHIFKKSHRLHLINASRTVLAVRLEAVGIEEKPSLEQLGACAIGNIGDLFKSLLADPGRERAVAIPGFVCMHVGQH